jgi:hypothetical protein
MAYDLVTGQRTFCIGVSGIGVAHGNITVDVPFVDSAGSGMSCNYFKMGVGGTDNNTDLLGVVAEVSGVSHVGNAVTDGLSALSGTPAPSGICGVGVTTAYLHGAQTEWHGSNGQVARGVRLVITNVGTSTKYNIMLTYGNLFPLNTLRTTNDLIYDAGV